MKKIKTETKEEIGYSYFHPSILNTQFFLLPIQICYKVLLIDKHLQTMKL